MAKTKLELQKIINVKLINDIGALEAESLESVEITNELQAELDECSGMNTRLNRTIVREREKIVTLKDVARFYRAQRDRVDAYLSATLDGIDRHSGKSDRDYPMNTECRSVADFAGPMMPQDRRPPVQEPSAMSGDDGRNFMGYRDSEPSTDWENL